MIGGRMILLVVIVLAAGPGLGIEQAWGSILGSVQGAFRGIAVGAICGVLAFTAVVFALFPGAINAGIELFKEKVQD